MNHIAIDLGGRKSQVCIRSADGSILKEQSWRTQDIGALLALQPPSTVVVETCAEAFSVADSAKTAGHKVRVVAATLAKQLGVGARRTKTDERDARALSEVSCRIELPSVHVPAKDSRDRKTLCGMREALVSTRTELINTVRGWMRASTSRVSKGSTETFAKRVRKAVPMLPSYVERQLKTIELLCEQIAEADQELSVLAKTDPVCRRLMTVPGVGPTASIRFAAAIDQVGRFDNAHAVESYFGLVPGEHSSSDKKRKTGITKCGSPEVRWILVQAAWAARQCRSKHPMVEWSREVEKRRGKRVAVLALARKIAGVLYALMRDQSVYSPVHPTAQRRTLPSFTVTEPTDSTGCPIS